MGEITACNLPIVSHKDEFHPIEGNGERVQAPTSHPVGGTAASPLDPGWLAATLSVLAHTHQVPGAQLAVHGGGHTVTVEVGELEHGTGVPVTGDTAFPIGSISKAWTATLAMVLVADGDLELDAPLAEYLPELGDLTGQLTLEQLLSHTSGFASSPETPDLSVLSLSRYVREHCRQQDLIMQPGAGFSYSSRNYTLVGHLIEKITGMDWWEAVESILLRPLGIDPATIARNVQVRSPRPIATGHSANATVGRIRPVQQSLIPAEAPAGALAMSAADLVTLGLMHVGPGFPELLPTSFAERMRQGVACAEPFGLADGWGLGLAVFREGTTSWVGHDGNVNGTSCYLRIDPANGWVVALTTNANTGSYLWEDLHAELGEANLPLGGHRRGILLQTSAEPPMKCVGYYSNGPMEYLVTAGRDGGLYLANGGELIARLGFSHDLVFVLQDLDTGRGLHIGRFLRDPTTQQIERLQIGGRLARRHQPPSVPEARTPAESVGRVSA